MLTLEQQNPEVRRQSIGASDCAALFGLSPWKSGLELWHEKRGDLEPDKKTGEKEAVKKGNLFEPVIIDYAANELNARVSTNPEDLERVHSEHGFITCNLDADVYFVDEAVEAKFTRMIDGYGEEGTDQVPPHVYIQAQHQMLVTKYKVVHVCVLGPFFDFRMYRVDRNDEITDQIEKRCVEFWKDVKDPARSEPPQYLKADPLSLEAVKRYKREEGKKISLPDSVQELIDKYNEHDSRIKALKEVKDQTQADLIYTLGDAEVGTLPDGTEIRIKKTKNGHKRFTIKPSN